MNLSSQPDCNLYFAAVGDVHGYIHQMVRLLQGWEKKHQKTLSFVLQVGDFEAHRHFEDLATMDAPTKYKQLGDFRDFYTGKAKLPFPLWFIGGNHESYGFLDLYPEGEEIAPNFNYLGRVNQISLAGLKIVGVSGIYKPELFALNKRPSAQEIERVSNKKYISFIESEIERALDYQETDILLLHDWAKDIISTETLKLFQTRYSNARYAEIGNEYASLLIEALKPKLFLCGHLHFKYRYSMPISPQTTSKICCMANVRQGKDAIAIFGLTRDREIIEVTEFR